MPLFTLETERVRMTWHGSPAPPDETAPPAHLVARAIRPGAVVEVRGERTRERGVRAQLPLRIAEQTTYRVLVQSRTGEPVTLRHADPALVAQLAADDGGRVRYGTISFRGQVGRSAFELVVGNAVEAAFTLDVVPTKATLADVEAMREDVDHALAGLALDYLGATTTPAGRSGAPPARATWLTLLRHALPDLETAMAVIARHPLRDLRRTPEPTRIESIRRPDSAVRRALRTRHLPTGGDAASKQQFPTILPARRAQQTLDTPEHRLLRARLDYARRAVLELEREEAVLPDTARRRMIRTDLRDATRRLGHLLAAEPVRMAARIAPPLPTPRLLVTPGYAEAYAALERLRVALALAGGPVPHATKDLPLLYEMWAYLLVVRLVASIVGRPIPPSAFLRAEHRGVRLLLRRGRRHAVGFEQEGRQIEVIYNPRLGARNGLLAQRPDVLLTITSAHEPPRWIVLDAKYRRDDSAAYRRRFGTAGPPADALGDLHRYRDAIVAEPAGGRVVEAAVALYPHRPGAGFEDSRLWRSVERIGVGAIPLLPDETTWLRRWLASVLA